MAVCQALLSCIDITILAPIQEPDMKIDAMIDKYDKGFVL